MIRGRRSLLARALLLFFALNVTSFAFYVLLRLPLPGGGRRRDPPLPPVRREAHPIPPSRKPWPPLPSFLPWHHSPRSRSCEAYFGHGFSRRADVLLPDGGSGWFRCFYSETLMCSVCEGGRVRMDPERIRMSVGGESLEAVMGRGEEEELPVYEDGAFQIEGGGARKAVDDDFLDRNMPRGAVQQHTMRALVGSMQVVGRGDLQCSQWIDEPTILVTRFEYANLFHTVTDWYSAYVSSRVTKLPFRPNVVFVDGHCKSPLEATWKAFFSDIRYAKNFSSPVCFRHVIFAPLGYETALFKGLTESISCQGTSVQNLRENPDDKKTARLSEFGEMISASFGLLENGNFPNKSSAGYNVLFVRREDYLAHPRHSGKVESRLSNEQEVFDAIKNWAYGQKKCKISVINGLFAHMHMKEQLRAIQEASVVIGAHGAGLTHLVAATPGTIVLEIISSMYRRPHFALISEWKGLEYHAINLVGSYAKPAMVLDKLSSIMHSLGC